MKLKFNLSLISLIFLISLVSSMDYHSDYQDLTESLKNFAQSYPTKSYLYSIGKTVENRDIWVMAIARSHPEHHIKLRPEVKYVGNMHGNQLPTREVLFHLIHILLENPHNDSNVDYILDNMRVHVLPSLNPDGAERTKEHACSGKIGRNNSNNVDLNRNFPDLYFCNNEQLQPETKAVIDWLESNTFILSAN